MQIYYSRSFTEIWPPGTFCWGSTKLLKLLTLVYLVISMNRERTKRRLGYVINRTIPYHTIPYHTIPYHTIPYHTIPYHTIPYIPYHTIPYHTIQVVTNLQQTCNNAVPTTCQQDVFPLLVPSLFTSCYKVVELNRLVTSCSNNLLSSCNSTICQQVVSNNLNKITALLQLVDKLATSLLRTHLVDKL